MAASGDESTKWDLVRVLEESAACGPYGIPERDAQILLLTLSTFLIFPFSLFPFDYLRRGQPVS